ncbi:MAG TPA: hypothetical protein EYP17_12575 [Candidatus Latescibacteria bacterium]|nr:hypothetical protein [Candidatus Latescibacterota bacterium]
MKDLIWSFGGLTGTIALVFSLLSGVSPLESLMRAGVASGVASGAAFLLIQVLSQILEGPKVEHRS